MNKLIPSACGLVAIVCASRAHALPVDAVFDAVLDGQPAGQLTFMLDSEIPGGACLYVALWDAGGGTVPEQCYLAEATSMGNFSCLENALAPIWSVVMTAPGLDCYGFDTTYQSTPIFLMLLGESAIDGSLEGMIQYSASSTGIDYFSATPVLPSQ